ncbi:succinyl-diaminopimelate desuccinylase [Aestuariibacter halophilus]|uniref:Succinyl-diaminopimelate desuccinylase n=1 Tax=Fluctibacter halophilus TaxID=226011 RepID=A0ABS8G2D2_9ALTE|nr:succinyl-diaminopimelate desuccinylase [Aestuariibacter halophilus]MCC2614633.1 succinyl-diaminopimelate desuccinylase [Aestuariibacter halophilus]
MTTTLASHHGILYSPNPAGQHIPIHGRSVAYTQALIRKPSVTPEDGGCQVWLAEKLSALGFECHAFVDNGVRNLIASIGQGGRAFGFAGHTDVVPPGPENRWMAPPFAATMINDEIIGRGASDMKSGLACMLAATERFIQQHGVPKQRFLWLVTSDEEGEAEYGSQSIVRYLQQQGIRLDSCLVGEPTASSETGDTIKVGRRGALTGRIQLRGKAGHVAYPKQTVNAIHRASAVIDGILALPWDEGSDDFPGTTVQITHVDSGSYTDNIVPAGCDVAFNVRYSDRFSGEQVVAMIETVIAHVAPDSTLHWERPCEPYINNDNSAGGLISAVERAVHANTGRYPLLSTSGGTSDGRFFAGMGAKVVELGVPNATIHQLNERVHVSDLVTLENIYTDLLCEQLGS